MGNSPALYKGEKLKIEIKTAMVKLIKQRFLYFLFRFKKTKTKYKYEAGIKIAVTSTIFCQNSASNKDDALTTPHRPKLQNAIKILVEAHALLRVSLGFFTKVKIPKRKLKINVAKVDIRNKLCILFNDIPVIFYSNLF